MTFPTYPSGKIRVCHVQALDAVGGTERTNFTLMRAMNSARFETEICILGHEGPYRAQYAAAGIRAHYLKGRYWQLRGVLRRGDFDIVFLYGLRANLLGRFLAGRSVLVEVKHGVDADRCWLMRALDRLSARRISAFVSNSRAGARVMQEYEGKPAKAITVIHNGIESREYAVKRVASSSAGLRLLAVSNLLPYKGLHFLIEAVTAVRAEGLQCSLRIAGEGPEREHLERMADASVELLGHRADVTQLLADSDVLVHASLTEGLPNAIMEAMAAALPVIATDAGGCGELVKDGETGLLVPAGSADALARGIRTLAASTSLRTRMGVAGRARMERDFPLKKMVDGFEGFCERHGRPDVLFITTTGMAVRYLIRDQISALSSAGYRVRVLCGEDEHARELKEQGMPLDTLPLGRFLRPAADMRALAAMVRHVRRIRPRIVHTCTPKAGLLGPLAARLCGIPSVHSVFGLLFHDRASRVSNAAYRSAEYVTAACSDALLFQSREDMDCIARLGWKSPERLVYVGNGVDLQHFRPPADRAAARSALGYSRAHFVVGMVARALRTKGVAEFLEAARRLQHVPSLRFVLVGPDESGHPGAISRGLLEDAGHRGNFQYLGEQRDMVDLYSAMDLFALPSWREGIPRSLIEASAMELPVIASDIRGCREVVEPDVTGWLIPPRDATTLAEVIAGAARNPGQGRAKGIAGRRKMQREFDERGVHTRLMAVYQDVLRSRGVLHTKHEWNTAHEAGD